jgi:hypothetical protein
MPEPVLATFWHEGKQYELDSAACYDTLACVVVLPDGRVLRVDGWADVIPPRPDKLTDMKATPARLVSPTGGDAAGPKSRLTLDLAVPVRAELDRVKAATGADSLVEVVRRALAVYSHVVGERQAGRRLVTTGKDGEREIVIL